MGRTFELGTCSCVEKTTACILSANICNVAGKSFDAENCTCIAAACDKSAATCAAEGKSFDAASCTCITPSCTKSAATCAAEGKSFDAASCSCIAPSCTKSAATCAAEGKSFDAASCSCIAPSCTKSAATCAAEGKSFDAASCTCIAPSCDKSAATCAAEGKSFDAASCACIKKSTPQPPLESCVYNVYPAVCVENVGFICGNQNEYYSSNQTRCSGGDKCVLCQSGYIGCSADADAFCTSHKSTPVYDPNKCKAGHRRCDGRKLISCDGTAYTSLIQTCTYCHDGEDGSDSFCASQKPACTFRDGTSAELIAWIDGDTALLRPFTDDDSCDSSFVTGTWPNGNPKTDYPKVRILGIDTPECTKAKNAEFGLNTCTPDSNYTAENDPYGYEAWHFAMSRVPPQTHGIIRCHETDAYNNCLKDIYERSLVYLEHAGRDYSAEVIAAGLAMPNIQKLPRLIAPEKAICQGLQTAITSRLNLYANCTQDKMCVSEAASALPSAKSGEFDKQYDLCQFVLGMMK
ncbi:MAG: thermonuclease family protein [Proteobacteria bacterium]|nr:thermonuclease family protein [Pseudomonadota bacterium]